MAVTESKKSAKGADFVLETLNLGLPNASVRAFLFRVPSEHSSDSQWPGTLHTPGSEHTYWEPTISRVLHC